MTILDQITHEAENLSTTQRRQTLRFIRSMRTFKLHHNGNKAGKRRKSPCMLRTLLQCPKGPTLKIRRDKSDNISNLPRVFD